MRYITTLIGLILGTIIFNFMSNDWNITRSILVVVLMFFGYLLFALQQKGL